MWLNNKCPITVVTGFLGSGKTTFLANILHNKEFRNTVVIINEYGQAGLDHRLIRRIDQAFERRMYMLQQERGFGKRAERFAYSL